MIGDKQRCDTARAAIELRRLRCEKFPSEIFDEHAWNLLLHTFVADVDNNLVSSEVLFDKSGMSEAVGRRWLAHLVKDGQIESHGDGNDIHLTARSIAAMRDYLDRVRLIGSRVLVDND